MELAKPKNWVDHVAIWCAKYLIIFIISSAFILGNSPEASLWVASGMTVAWVLAFLFQYIFKRPRPFKSGHPALVKMLFVTPSFPSAHTAIAASIASSVFFVSPSLAVVFALLAVLMAWSRVRTNLHYVSDTIAGAFVGAASPFVVSWMMIILLGLV